MSRFKATTRAALLLTLGLVATGLAAQNARIVEWVENGSPVDNMTIALGYPPPIPVETPLPFAGFRSYGGLHARHQDIAATSPWTHAMEIGRTHKDRTIWAYRLSDPDTYTVYGIPEQAMLTNGGIHAREWQSPEVATGIIELIGLAEDDHHLISYLRENAGVMVIPVLNIDGFLQTQRYPTSNWLGTDPNDPEFSPRDGRMRRKNLLLTDEVLLTQDDHLLGVDLNRNNAPYWNTNPGRSSGNPFSLVHHGGRPHSEPETRALEMAAQLAPPERLTMYTDLHSFSQVHFWVRNSNIRLARLTEGLLNTFSNHHVSFPAGKYYAFASMNNVAVNRGIGSTDEYFTHLYQVPSWTLEIEPSDGQAFHAPLPGQGADYGGLGRNGHDGFILPDSQVERVRTELAQTFSIAYYHQTAPPAVTAVRITDAATGATVFEAEWDVTGDTSRELHSYQPQPVQLDRDYEFWLSYDKPMRWRIDGEVAPLPGQPESTLDLDAELLVGNLSFTLIPGEGRWLDQPGGAPGGYAYYRDDALVVAFRLPADANNTGLADGKVTATLATTTTGMTGVRNDADPSTVARWMNGAWAGYENSEGSDQTDTGGIDSTVAFEVTADDLGDPFVIEPGTSSAWFDPGRNGEGFLLEILSGDSALMYWFTYDDEGRQDWYIAQGEIRGNRIVFPELMQAAGGEFGPGFDPDKVTRTTVGSASFIWSGCDRGRMDWRIPNPDGSIRHGRMDLYRLERVMGLACGEPVQAPEIGQGRLSGSWYDPTHSGEGYVLEVLADGRALVYWFSFDPQGNRRWFYGVGEIRGDTLVFEDMFTTRGGIFGEEFDPALIENLPWGSLELDLQCAAGEARFTPTEPGFAAGTLDLDRLTVIDGLSCD
jgi:hypothetical protein